MKRWRWVPVGGGEPKPKAGVLVPLERFRAGPIELRRGECLFDVLGPGWALLGNRFTRSDGAVQIAESRRKQGGGLVLVNHERGYLSFGTFGNIAEVGLGTQAYVLTPVREELRSPEIYGVHETVKNRLRFWLAMRRKRAAAA